MNKESFKNHYCVCFAAIPRQIIVHDIFNFMESGVVSSKLRDEMPDLLSLRPITQEDQVASIKTLSHFRYSSMIVMRKQQCARLFLHDDQVYVASDFRSKKWNQEQLNMGKPSTARRTRKAKNRVAKMRVMYGLANPQGVSLRYIYGLYAFLHNLSRLQHSQKFDSILF